MVGARAPARVWQRARDRAGEPLALLDVHGHVGRGKERIDLGRGDLSRLQEVLDEAGELGAVEDAELGNDGLGLR